MTVRDKIKPFVIVDYNIGGALHLYSVEDYKQEIFDTRKAEGFTGTAAQWHALAELFVAEEMPDLIGDIEIESESDILTIYADDCTLLEAFAVKFKAALDDDELIYPLFNRL
ncbi:MAG: immunity 51 family protein [Oscillospiraceae bacterium]|nr:immunity 51 family protein [Oscillospiraceae bacterium]